MIVVALLAIAALAAQAFLAVRFIQALRQDLADERARTRELLSLVEVQRAPAAHASLMFPTTTAEDSTWLHDETGLFGAVIDDA